MDLFQQQFTLAQNCGQRSAQLVAHGRHKLILQPHNTFMLSGERDLGLGAGRKLLLKRLEIDRIKARVDQDRLTLVPLSLYFKDGRAKVELALVRGRRSHDKREAIKEREAGREADRAIRGQRGGQRGGRRP